MAGRAGGRDIPREPRVKEEELAQCNFGIRHRIVARGRDRRQRTEGWEPLRLRRGFGSQEHGPQEDPESERKEEEFEDAHDPSPQFWPSLRGWQSGQSGRSITTGSPARLFRNSTTARFSAAVRPRGLISGLLFWCWPPPRS